MFEKATQRRRASLERASRSVAARLFALVSIALLVIFALLGFLNIRLHRRDSEAAVLRNAANVSDVIKQSTAFHMMRNDREAIYETMRTIGSEPGMVRLRIFNQEGRISYSTEPAEMNRLVDKSAEACYGCHTKSEPLVHLDRPDRFRIFHAGGERVLGVVTPINNSPTCSSADCHAHPPEQKVLGILDANLSLAESDMALSRTTWLLALITVIGVVSIAILVGFVVFTVVYRPIRKLTAATNRLAAGELGHEIELDSNDEIGDLGRAFNTMSRQLNEANEEITAWTRTLEARVDQKTQELRVAHEQMLQSEKLASLGKMSAVVAHEINNPLSGILTYAKLLRRWLDRGENLAERRGEMRDSLQLIESESRRCGEIVRNLLTFARAAPMNLQWVDVNNVIKQCVRLLEHKLDLGNISLKLDVAQPMPLLYGDAAQIEQLLLALMINAIEAMPREGLLRVSTSAEGSDVRIEIEDDGVGIPSEFLPRVFEPFASAKENGQGVGLGLAISKTIVDRHRGTIEVKSEPGRGTLFTIILPRSAAGVPAGNDANAVTV